MRILLRFSGVKTTWKLEADKGKKGREGGRKSIKNNDDNSSYSSGLWLTVKCHTHTPNMKCSLELSFYLLLVSLINYRIYVSIPV